MDKEIRKELTELVGAAITAATKAQSERYVTGARLCEMFQMFTPSRLKTWGCTLPRIRATFIGEDGETEQTGWAYNVKAIQEMIDRNELVFVMKPKDAVVYKPSRGRGKRSGERNGCDRVATDGTGIDKKITIK